MSLGIFFDTETTGLPLWKEPSGHPDQPHIVQLAAIVADLDTKKVIHTMNVIVRPDGWVIPPDVTEIHGITTDMAMDVGIPENLAMTMFMSLWGTRMRIAHNISFDDRIIRIALKRHFNDEIAELYKEGDTACTGELAKPIMCMEPKNRFGYKMPNLVEAYLHFTGKGLRDAHSAMADAKACMDVYFAIKEQQDKGE